MYHNENERIMACGEPVSYRYNGKFYICRISRVNGREEITFKKYHNRNGWKASFNECKQFTKQEAENVISSLKKKYNTECNKGLIEFKIIDAWDEL